MPFSRLYTTEADGPEIITDSCMPPFGVAEVLLGTQPDLFQFWLLTHRQDIALVTGPMFWRTAVLRECLPREIDVAAGLQFTALAEPLR
jgi:hypothetical protein